MIDDLGDNDDPDAEDNVVFLPSTEQTYSMWYKRRYITIGRDRVNNGYGRSIDYLHLRYVLAKFCLECCQQTLTYYVRLGC